MSATATETQVRFSWRQAPELMARLERAQNALKAPIDIMTFAGFCDSREELERHVVHYEQQTAKERVISTLAGYCGADRAARSAPTPDNVFTLIRATNALLDACVDFGMPHGTADLEGWAAQAVARAA